MRLANLVLVLVFFFSEVASATTCDLLDGAYVEASDGTYLGFFGASSATDSIANSSSLYGSQAGVNSVRNSSGLYGSSSGLNSANNSVSLNPPKIYTGVQFLGFLSTNTTKSPRIEVETAVSDCSFTESTPKLVGEGFLSLDLNSSTSVSFFGENKAGYKIDVVQAGILKINVISPDGVNYRLYNSSSVLLGGVDCSAISDCDEAAFSFETDGKDINVAVESESTGILFLVAGPTADYISGSGTITTSFEAATQTVDEDAPVLVSIAADKDSVDVSSGEAQTVKFTLNATDATGIDWAAGANKTNVVLKRPIGNAQTGSSANAAYKYALSTSDDPGVFTVNFGQSDFSGDWSVSFAQLQDTLGNRSTYSANSLLDLGLDSQSITVVGGVEADIPTLESITVDKVSVDVSASAQVVTFAITATDLSDIVWDAGANQTDVVLQGPDSSYRYAISSNESPGVFTVEFESDDPRGTWDILRAELKDSVGNRGLYSPSLLITKGLFTNKLFVFDDQTETSSLASIPVDVTESLVVGATSDIAIKLVNEGSDVLQNIEFSFTSENMSVSQVSLDGGGALACSLTSVNFVTNGSCSFSSLEAGESKSIILTVTAGTVGVAGLTGFGLPERPEVTFANNTFAAEYTVVADEVAPVITLVGDAAVTHALGTDYTDAGATATDDVDGDITSSITTSGTVATGTAGTYTITYSVSDSAGNAATQVIRTVTVESVGTDTDGDGTPDDADTDDDGDGVLDDLDAFPKNEEESVDTDGDGIGNNADEDDDGDEVPDVTDAFPLVSLDGRIDTDGDGFPNDCDNSCLATGMLADEDDDNDGVVDVDDAFPLDASRSTDESSGNFSFDIDGNAEAQPLTDGLLVIRHLFGFSGESLRSGAVSGEAGRDSSEAIASYLTDADSELDIDGDGEAKPLTDGLLLIRYLFGFSGDSLISGAIGDGATRDTADAVEAYIKERVPAE